MTGEREASEPPSPFDDEAAAPRLFPQSGIKITIADILFCMFALSMVLSMLYQSWGGFEEVQSAYWASGTLIALHASVFFTANRIRRRNRQSFFSMAPGHFLALLGACSLASWSFQYLVSFLDSRHVGDPIHILASLSPCISSMAITSLILFKTRFTPRWQSVFFCLALNSVFIGFCTGSELFGSHSDLNDPINIIHPYMWRLAIGTATLSVVFILIALVFDLFDSAKKDWLHYAGILLEIAFFIAAFLEDSWHSQLYWYVYYQFA